MKVSSAIAFSSVNLAWRPSPTHITRLAGGDGAVSSYDPETHIARAVLSSGAPVRRLYGVEVLKITSAAIKLDRLASCGVPLIDSHNIYGVGTVLGRVDRAWISGGELLGVIAFDDNEAGRAAEGQVARGTVRGVSVGYKVDEWEIKDADGNVVDPERDRLMWDEDYRFEATKWELLEVSLVSVPADPSAFIRSYRAFSPEVQAEIRAARAAAVLANMRARTRVVKRSLALLQQR